MITIFKDGERIGQSKNLRGINDRCLKVPGARATVAVFNDRSKVDVWWPDGSFASVPFGSSALAFKYANTKRFRVNIQGATA